MVLKILKDMEDYRRMISSGEMTAGTPDHAIRFCQAIVAEQGGYKDRVSWLNDLKIEDFESAKATGRPVLSVNIDFLSATIEKMLAVLSDPAGQIRNFVGFSYLSSGQCEYDVSADEDIFPLVVIINSICSTYLTALKIPEEHHQMAIEEIIRAMMTIARMIPNTLPNIYKLMCAEDDSEDIPTN